jgi:hypothetical protein
MATIVESAATAASSADQAASAASYAAQAASSVSAQISAAASGIEQAMIRVSGAASAVAAAAAPKTDFSISWDAWANSGATLIAALVGAFLGGWLTYLVQSNHRRKLDEQAAVITAHRVAFCVFQQSDTILKYQRDFVHEHIDDPNRFISIPGQIYHDEAKFTFSIDDLLPLFDDPKLRTILYHLYSAQEAYTTAMAVWNERAKIHIIEMQPKLAASKILSGGMHTWREIEDALGRYVMLKLANMTMTAQATLQQAFLAQEQMRKPFFEYIKKRFPKEKFTEFGTPEEARIREEIKPIEMDRSSPSTKSLWAWGDYVVARHTLNVL